MGTRISSSTTCCAPWAHPDEQPTSRLQSFYISEAIDFVKEHYQADITVEDIAKQTGLNRSYFGKVFKAATGKSPQQYLIGYRMGKAAELLKLTALPVAEVGRAVGYPNPAALLARLQGTLR